MVNRTRALIAVDLSPRLTAQAMNLRPGANAEEITVVMVAGVARNLLRRSNRPVVVVPEFGGVS